MTTQQSPAPGRGKLLLQTLWPSFRRVVLAIFSALGLPFFILSVIGFSNLMVSFGWVNVDGFAAWLLGYFEIAQTWVLERLSAFDISLPPALISGALVYLSFANTIARSEKNEILTVELDAEERKENLRDATKRIDALFYAVPKFLRPLVLRLFWPLVVLHRLGTPFVIEGPGPSGNFITSSVERGELVEFADMVHKSGAWQEQTVYDQRQIAVWHFILMSGASTGLQFASAYFA